MQDDILDNIDFPEKNPQPNPKEQYMELFFGKRADIYLQHWKQGNPWSFNLLHLLLGVPWLLYRKMYFQAAALFFSPIMITYGGIKVGSFYYLPALGIIKLGLDYLNNTHFPAYLVPLGITMWVCGVWGKQVYIAHAENQVTRLMSTHRNNEEKLLAALSYKGGVEYVLPVITLMYFLMAFLNSLNNMPLNQILIF